MMENDKEKWIEEVFESIQGSKRAKPSPGLFAKIEAQIDNPDAVIIPMFQRRVAAAAAILLLALNVFALRQYMQQDSVLSNESVAMEMPNQQLISNYNIYNR